MTYLATYLCHIWLWLSLLIVNSSSQEHVDHLPTKSQLADTLTKRIDEENVEVSLIFMKEKFVGKKESSHFYFRSNAATIDDLLSEVHEAVMNFKLEHFRNEEPYFHKQILDAVLNNVQEQVSNKSHYKEQILRMKESKENEMMLQGWIHSTALSAAAVTTPQFSAVPVNSFDIFDTILARDVHEPTDIFKIIEKEFPFPMFNFYRRLSETLHGSSLNAIYETFQKITKVDNETIEHLKQFEIETEIAHSYLILQNYNLVRDGDILVSDMYLPPEAILRMLLNAGFDKNVDIYVTMGGKAQGGWIYEPLNRKYNISLHFGDNYQSDIVQAQAHGLATEYTTIHAPVRSELSLHTYGGESGMWMAQFLRRFRLGYNLFPKDSRSSNIFLEQAEYNIPLLLASAQRIVKIMNESRLTRLLLTTRDGCLLEKIFAVLYPEVDARRFEASRFIYTYPTDEYKRYLKEMYIPKKTLIFDIYGHFHSGRALFLDLFGEIPRVEFISRSRNVDAEVDELLFSSKILTSMLDIEILDSDYSPWGIDILEELNLDVVGPLSQVYTFRSEVEMGRILPGHPNEAHPNHRRLFFRAPNAYYLLDDIRLTHAIIDTFVSFVKIMNPASVRHHLENCFGDIVAWDIFYSSRKDFKFEVTKTVRGVRGFRDHHYDLAYNDEVKEWGPFGSSLEVALKPYFDKQIDILLICKDDDNTQTTKESKTDIFINPSTCDSYNFLVNYLGPFACYFAVYKSTINALGADYVLSLVKQEVGSACLRAPSTTSHSLSLQNDATVSKSESEVESRILFDFVILEDFYNASATHTSTHAPSPQTMVPSLQRFVKPEGQIMYRAIGQHSEACNMKHVDDVASETKNVSDNEDTCFRCHEGRCGLCFTNAANDNIMSHASTCTHNCLCVNRKHAVPENLKPAEEEALDSNKLLQGSYEIVLSIPISIDSQSVNTALPSSFSWRGILPPNGDSSGLYKDLMFAAKQTCDALALNDYSCHAMTKHAEDLFQMELNGAKEVFWSYLNTYSTQNLLPEAHSNYLLSLRDNYNFYPNVIYDIGSSTLHWANVARMIWPESKIILFDAFEEAEYLYKENNYLDYHIGLLASPELSGSYIKFYQNNFFPGGNSYFRELDPIDKDGRFFSENVALLKMAKTLDEVVKERGFPLPDLIKIDVQGAERDVILGSKQTLASVEHLIVEMQHDDYNEGAPKVHETRPLIESLSFECIAPMFSVNGPDADYGFRRIH